MDKIGSVLFQKQESVVAKILFGRNLYFRANSIKGQGIIPRLKNFSDMRGENLPVSANAYEFWRNLTRKLQVKKNLESLTF